MFIKIYHNNIIIFILLIKITLTIVNVKLAENVIENNDIMMFKNKIIILSIRHLNTIYIRSISQNSGGHCRTSSGYHNIILL